MIDYIQKGGLLMWPILACSVIAIAVFAERVAGLANGAGEDREEIEL